MRDWMADLYPASFRGVAFWVERDHGATGRAIAVTPFVGSDLYDIEDMHVLPPTFEVTGYCAGDASDRQMASLEAAFAAQGPGVLVLPAQGPINARGLLIKRDRMRDRMGRFGFEARFIQEPGLSSAAQPAAYLAQLAFDAVGQLSAAASGFLNGVSL